MAYKPTSLFRLLGDINYDLFLPHIQRPFVWDEDQIRRLFDSLMRNYPIQTFLFWRTKDAIKVRKFMDSLEWETELHKYYEPSKSAGGVEKRFVLDGQQRLQALYALFKGTIILDDDKPEQQAYIDITGGQEPSDTDLLYELTFSPRPLQLPSFRLRDLIERHDQVSAEEIADELNDQLDHMLDESDDEQKARQKRVRLNCSKLTSLLREENCFWVEELDGVARDYPYKKILNIFVRVNSGGTKLEAADLLFAAMKEGWADVEQNVEEIVGLLSGKRLAFDKSLVLKCLVVAHGKGAELSPEKFTSTGSEELLKSIETNWSKAADTFHQLRDFIEHDLQLYSEKVIRSYGSFVPLFDYMYHNPKPGEEDRILMRAYYYKSQLFGWFRARTDGLIDTIHRLVGRRQQDGFPIGLIKDYFATSRGARTELTRDHLGNNGPRLIFLNLVYVEQFGQSPFNVRFKGNAPHVDHIYPQSPLRSKLGLSSGEINHIGNFRLFGASDNNRKRAELPADYFSRLKKAGCKIEKHLLLSDVSEQPSLLKFDVATYSSFRDRRFEEIFKIAERVVNAEVIQPRIA